MAAASLPKKLKDPRTCRVFVSSPFGGIEREREELVARYFPQLAALCQAKGVSFVAVDMRWGITEEAASDNQVVNICLREIDRSDFFLGIYGQRYGWHGEKDEGLQRNIELSVKRYPWLKNVKDRSVTEFEFLHGHLNKPGAVPASFAFRAKGYDDHVHAQSQDAKQKLKYVVESPEAEKKLNALKAQVRKTKSKCLAIHDDYKTPEDAAKLLFKDMKEHLEKVLLKDAQALSALGLELACHDAYMATRTAFYVGGQNYMKQLDQTLAKGGTGHLVVGPEGSGKGALLCNWVAGVLKKKTHEVIYHFVGCSKDSSSVGGILQRFIDELERMAGVEQKKKSLDSMEEKAEAATASDLSDLFQNLQILLDRAAKKKKKILIVIDGLSRIRQISRTSKTLFWLPVELPHKAVTVVVTCREDDTDVKGELAQRGYSVTKMDPLSDKQQKDICVGILQRYSKELSAAQLKKILDVKQTENPLFLKIVISELCAFGNFHLLDSKINSLITAKSVAELFVECLVRLEEDYNGEKENDKTLIQKVMCSLTLAKKGLTEPELRGILDVPSATWSPVYFAIKDYILDHSGLLQPAFQELREAVETRYMSTKKEKDGYLQNMIQYFDKLRKSFPVTIELDNAAVARVGQELPWLLHTLGDKRHLTEALTDLTVFARMFTEEEYELLDMWRSTGMTGEQITTLYMRAIEERKRQYEKETTTKSAVQVIDMFILSFLDALTYFLELNHYTGAVEVVLRERLKILENSAGKINEERRLRMEGIAKVKLSYMYAETGAFPEAKALLEDVLQYRIQNVEKSKGAEALLAMKDLAVSYHAIGILHSKMDQLDNALVYYQKSMELHARLEQPVEFADSMNNLGVMLMKKGNYEEAAALCSKALKIYEEEYFGHLPPILGVLTGNIAVCYRNLNKLEESEKMYKKAVDIAERSLGRNHPNVAVALTNLGTLEVNRNMYEEAEKYFSEAIAIHKACETTVGNNDLFKAREKYVYTLVKLNKPQEAVKAFSLLYDQAVTADLLSKAWPPVWCEIVSVLLAGKLAERAAEVAAALLGAGLDSEGVLTLLDQADRMTGAKVKRAPEMTVDGGLKKNPKSQLLLSYQTQQVLIPGGQTSELLAVLDRSEAALKAGANLYHAAMSWCIEAGKKDMAEAVLMHAAPKFKEDGSLASQMAGKLRDEEKFKEALPYVTTLLKNKPDDPNVLLFSGEIFLRAEEFTKAKVNFMKVTTICKPATNEHKQGISGLGLIERMSQKK